VAIAPFGRGCRQHWHLVVAFGSGLFCVGCFEVHGKQ
jgi:hypothetical protein